MTVFSQTYQTNVPGNAADPTETPKFDREAKAGVQQRADVDHYWEASGANTYDDADTGEHRKVTIRTLSAAQVAALASAKAYLYRLVTDGELYFKDASDNTIKLTSGGRLVIANDTYFIAADNAGTGTVNMIKVNASDKPVLLDGAEMASNAAPSAAAGIANRKFVLDMMLPAATAVRVGYTGGESVTLPNGRIEKAGKTTTPTGDPGTPRGTEVITFAAAFPNAIISVNAVMKDGTLSSEGPDMIVSVQAASVSAITLAYRETFSVNRILDGIYWEAKGW